MSEMQCDPQSAEVREALRIAEDLAVGTSLTGSQIERIAAALLEARADGIKSAIDWTTWGKSNGGPADAERLRAEAQQLRRKET